MVGKSHLAVRLRLVCLMLLMTAFSVGCAYYNYYYNAQKYFKVAEKSRKEDVAGAKTKKSSASPYDKVTESANRMLLYYPNSKWEDDALVLLAEAYYRQGKYRPAITKVDELIAKYPSSQFIERGLLFKGLSLIWVAQKDSGSVLLGQLAAECEDKSIVAEIYFGLAENYFHDDRWEPAFDQYKLAAEAGSPDKWIRSAAWVKMGDCLGHLKRYDDAVKLYDGILAEKIPRRLQFEASLQRASALRNSGQYQAAFDVCEKLLDDAAFAEEFPRVQLEAALCEKALGMPDESRVRLEELLDDKKQGATSAQAQYELGLLIWEHWKDYDGATTALKAVKSAERSATAGVAGDSLLAEVEALSRFWLRMRFLDRQQVWIDSARAGLRPLLPADTIWVDSLAAPPKPKAPEKGRKGKVKEEKKDPIALMVEAAMAADSLAQDSIRADSLRKVAVADSLAKGLDSLQIAKYDSTRQRDRQGLYFGLAEYHLFNRRDNDSAQFYFAKLLDSGVTGDLWAKGIASRAYIARSQGDTLGSDSLYRLILENPPDDEWRNRALRIFGQEVPAIEKSRTEMLVDSAEAEWRIKGDVEGARMIYLLASETADSGDTIAARALFAAAYLTRAELHQDSLAGILYAQVGELYPTTTYAKAASKYANKARKKIPTKEPGGAAPTETDEEALEKAEYEAMMQSTSKMPEETDVDKIYEAADVDELPKMLTMPDVVEANLRSFYPFDAYPESKRGEVEVEFVVRSNGETTDPKVTKVTPEGYGFDEAALSVFAKLEYRPGRLKGKPVNIRFKQVFTFKPPEDR